MKHTLKKKERLKSRKTISAIFTKGKVISAYPIKLFWTKVENEDLKPIQFGFSVPKKKFKKAVDRNSIKRLMFEAVRLNKHILTSENGIKSSNLAFMLLYVGKEKTSYQEVESKIAKCFNHFNEKKI